VAATYFKLEDLTNAQILGLHNKFVAKEAAAKKFANKQAGLDATRAAIEACLAGGWTEDNVHDAVLNWASETKYKSAPAGLTMLWREGEEAPAPGANDTPIAPEPPAAPAAPAAPATPAAKGKGGNLPVREPRIANGTLLKVGPNTRKGKIEAFQKILGANPFKIEDGAKLIAESYKPSRAEAITEGSARGYLTRGVDEGWFVKA